MTVQAGVLRSDYIGTGSAVDFAIGFQILNQGHLEVYLTDPTDPYNPVLQELGTDYTVSGDLRSGSGIVTFVVPPIALYRIVIVRRVPLNQLTDYEQFGDFPAESHEQALDKLTMQSQEFEEKLNRCVKIPVSSDSSYNFPLPSAGRSIVWDEAATALENGPTSTEISNAQGYAESAATSETNAAASATSASTSATNAANSATAAATSESNAATSASLAESYKNTAAISESNAATSASNAATDASSAASSALAASNSASAAATSETNSATNASTAQGYAASASTSASNAATSATNAATSETNAANSATAAAASAAEAAQATFSYTVKEFTSTTTWTVPAGVTIVEGICIGGGGGGGGTWGSSSVNNAGGGGGAGAGVHFRLVGLTPGSTLTLTIGAGGAGVANGTGLQGSASSVGSYVTCNGGLGGSPGQGVVESYSAAGGNVGYYSFASSGNVTVYILSVQGHPGGVSGLSDGNTQVSSGLGGSSFIHRGPAAVLSTANANGNAGISGAGGSGAAANASATADRSGGAGGSGYIQLRYREGA